MKITLLLLFILSPVVCYAEDVPLKTVTDACTENDQGFRANSQGRGWFWKQQECIPKEPEVTQEAEHKEWKLLPTTANIPWELLDRLDPSEIAEKIEPQARKVSVMYPTTENITAYRQLNNWLLTKSIAYANADQQVRTENPSLMPWLEETATSSFKDAASYEFQEKAKKEALLTYTGRAGLIVYVSASCGYCEKQAPILDMFEERYGWEVVYRELSEYPRDAEALNVATVPDMFIAFKDNTGTLRFQRIATGLTTLDLLEKAALRGLSYLGEELNEKLISY